MKNIITIQHTQSIHHNNGMIGSCTDWDLTDLGIKQAKTIGEKLSKELNGEKYVMYSSSLLRAKHTAQMVLKHLNIVLVYKDELGERHLGKAVGKSKQWVNENVKSHEKTIDDRIFPDAESKREKWAQLVLFYEEIMASDDEHIIIVAHGESLGIFNAIWLGLEVEVLNKCGFWGKPGGVSFLSETSDGKHIIHKISDMSYMLK